jgi:hypothetical protein
MNLLPHLLGATNFTGYKPHQVDGDLRWIQAEKFDSIFFLPRDCNHGLVYAHLDCPTSDGLFPVYTTRLSGYFKELNRWITSWYWIPV